MREIAVVFGIAVAGLGLFVVWWLWTMATHHGGNPFAALSLGLGLAGPWIVLGFHLVFWIGSRSKRRDGAVVLAMLFLVVQGVVTLFADSNSGGPDSWLPGVALWFGASFLLPAAVVWAPHLRTGHKR